MIYKFKSKAAGDTLMLQPHGDRLLTLIGREPAPKGIIEPAAMPAAIEALQRAAALEDAERAQQGEPAAGSRRDPVSLRQRVWPMVEMMRQAHAAEEPIVWGV
ncbi:MAG: DUF1840 domain-containing protein [Rubrivivax sp.]|nr:DUF1840 domain-containing protein [Rubrivivax sp.]